MSALVPGIEIMAVADLYAEYARLARSYDAADNPLHLLTGIIPARAEFYTVVPVERRQFAETLMNRVRGRRKLRSALADKDAFPTFSRSEKVLVLYA